MIFTLRKGGTELFDTGSHICRYGVEFEVLPGTESLLQGVVSTFVAFSREKSCFSRFVLEL
jgi:hypothetical protein